VVGLAAESGKSARAAESGRVGVTQVLVVDRDPVIRRALRVGLEARGLRVEQAGSCAEALEKITACRFDLVLLDLGPPDDDDGVSLVRRVRPWSEVPIIVLTADTHEIRKVGALDAGADDCVTKPFSMPELLARVRVALRHGAPRGEAIVDQSVFEVGDLRIDVAHHTCEIGGVEIDLTPKEFGILTVLARWPGKVVTHRMLLHEVWGPGYVNETQYLRTYATTIRRKLGCTRDRQRLVSEPGVGYRLLALDGVAGAGRSREPHTSSAA
jgi:two-component system, OmpR family, KDP operon response regulator KdpE